MWTAFDCQYCLKKLIKKVEVAGKKEKGDEVMYGEDRRNCQGNRLILQDRTFRQWETS